jgi:hypothetical protein
MLENFPNANLQTETRSLNAFASYPYLCYYPSCGCDAFAYGAYVDGPSCAVAVSFCSGSYFDKKKMSVASCPYSCSGFYSSSRTSLFRGNPGGSFAHVSPDHRILCHTYHNKPTNAP